MGIFADFNGRINFEAIFKQFSTEVIIKVLPKINTIEIH
ncbi:hypothetical protein GXM_04167 [Nostoc sphaeroides CCNUC1]|uniref:Uncharacterized protein n=1 Tax=Nostoc sphaeroides CCNUC1 TaxID=2653204 RepID=A0A5P8W331_9NOSO|nr:hypothetical protein GXM_04167 [Nostoc sphaeroides CCNUC1]